MAILIGVLVVVGLLVLGWWMMSGSSFGSEMTDERKRRARASYEWDKKHPGGPGGD